VINKTWYSNN